jgi:hypothetical protein
MNYPLRFKISPHEVIPLSMVFRDLLLFFNDSSSSCPLNAGDGSLSLSFFFSRLTKSRPFLILFDRVVSLFKLPGRCFGFAGVIVSEPPPIGRCISLEVALGVRVNWFSLAKERRGLLDRSERARALEVSLLSREVSKDDEANTTEELASSRRRFC